VASKLAHQHLSPFNVEIFNQSFCTLTKACGFIPPFVYPPNIIPLIWFLGYFSSNTAFTIWIAMHILAIGLALWGANILLESKSPALRTICTISVALIYGLVRDLQVGNIAIFVVVLILWMFILARKHQDIPAAILILKKNQIKFSFLNRELVSNHDFLTNNYHPTLEIDRFLKICPQEIDFNS